MKKTKTLIKSDTKALPSTTVTSKKVKVEGVQRYINPFTGEIEEFLATKIEDRDFNFSKVFMKNFISALDIIGSKKMQVAFYIIDNLNKDNQFIGTVRRIAEDTKTSLQTVNITLKALMETDFLRRQQVGVYVVNPDMIFNGTHNTRLRILNTYQQIGYEPPKPTKEEQIKTMEKTIEELNRRLIELKKDDIITVDGDGQLEFTERGEYVERVAEITGEENQDNDAEDRSDPHRDV